ncbi:DUF4902 domain-containing protein [Roseateles aquae]|uniref:DUF4902 domain-containing protein n=1 Tax=Roseateles aquae TaxID=3077235 RepID=UPI003312F9D1
MNAVTSQVGKPSSCVNRINSSRNSLPVRAAKIALEVSMATPIRTLDCGSVSRLTQPATDCRLRRGQKSGKVGLLMLPTYLVDERAYESTPENWANWLGVAMRWPELCRVQWGHYTSRVEGVFETPMCSGLTGVCTYLSVNCERPLYLTWRWFAAPGDSEICVLDQFMIRSNARLLDANDAALNRLEAAHVFARALAEFDWPSQVRGLIAG